MNTISPCPFPEYVWVDSEFRFSACVHCGSIAWDHVGADALGDLRRYAEWVKDPNSGPVPPPPQRRKL